MRLGKKLGNKITYIKKLDVASLIIVLAMFLVLIAGIFVVSDNYKENQEKLIEDAMELQSQSHKEKELLLIKRQLFLYFLKLFITQIL